MKVTRGELDGHTGEAQEWIKVQGGDYEIEVDTGWCDGYTCLEECYRLEAE